jgi:hypothetical protein
MRWDAVQDRSPMPGAVIEGDGASEVDRLAKLDPEVLALVEPLAGVLICPLYHAHRE